MRIVFIMAMLALGATAATSQIRVPTGPPMAGPPVVVVPPPPPPPPPMGVQPVTPLHVPTCTRVCMPVACSPGQVCAPSCYNDCH